MTHFEYIFVAVSIVLSFTILRLLDALPSAFSRARGYWVHTVWVVFLLFLCAGFWWLNWFNHTLDSLSFRYFLFLLVAPSILFLTATALVSASPPAVASWREHFDLFRLRFFVSAFIYIGLLTINSFATFAVPLAHPIHLGQVSMLGLFLAGATIKSQRGQRVVGGAAAVFLTLVVVLAVSGRIAMSLE